MQRETRVASSGENVTTESSVSGCYEKEKSKSRNIITALGVRARARECVPYKSSRSTAREYPPNDSSSMSARTTCRSDVLSAERDYEILLTGAQEAVAHPVRIATARVQFYESCTSNGMRSAILRRFGTEFLKEFSDVVVVVDDTDLFSVA